MMIVDLEEQLVEDKHGIELRGLKNQLEESKQKLKGELRRGVSPTELKDYELLIAGIEAASDVIIKYWSKHHS